MVTVADEVVTVTPESPEVREREKVSSFSTTLSSDIDREKVKEALTSICSFTAVKSVSPEIRGEYEGGRRCIWGEDMRTGKRECEDGERAYMYM